MARLADLDEEPRQVDQVLVEEVRREPLQPLPVVLLVVLVDDLRLLDALHLPRQLLQLAAQLLRLVVLHLQDLQLQPQEPDVQLQLLEALLLDVLAEGAAVAVVAVVAVAVARVVEGLAAPVEGALQLRLRLPPLRLQVLQRVQTLVQTLDRLLTAPLHVVDYDVNG